MIDGQRGLFEVRTRDLGTRTPSGVQRLRSGDTVRRSGRLLNAQRFEPERFR